MTIREQQQERERQMLADWATKSYETRGRQRPMAECPYRTCFQRDRDRIIHSKAFRRLSQQDAGIHFARRATTTARG